jgi:hypothetical protein
VRALSSVLVAILVIAGGSAASAQGVSSVGSVAAPEQMQSRFQIVAMESVLVRAVQLGAQRLSQQVQSVSPDMLFITGSARAKGFWLDGYGVFFDVDVPAMRRSIAWQFRTLDRGDPNAEAAVRVLRQKLALIRDAQLRKDIEDEFQRIERTFGPLPGAAGSSLTTTTVSATQPGRPASAGSPGEPPAASPGEAGRGDLLDDPGLAYTNEVKAALIDAMLDYGRPIAIADGEWLTVAARDSDDSRMGVGDPYDVSTIILRIRGSDLAGLRGGRISKEEARGRVEVREY